MCTHELRIDEEGPMSGLSKQIAAYEEMRDYLETDHFGEWVVLHAEELVGTYDSFEDAADDAVRRFGRGPYLIRRVGAGPIRLSSSILYGHVNAIS